jgi:hypothetical protein
MIYTALYLMLLMRANPLSRLETAVYIVKKADPECIPTWLIQGARKYFDMTDLANSGEDAD